MTSERVINNIKVTVHGEITDKELAIYLDEYQGKRKDKMVRAVVRVTDENIDIEGYSSYNVPFERIRRITGYLVGAMDKWNNGKRAEEKDRVKHGIGGGR